MLGCIATAEIGGCIFLETKVRGIDIALFLFGQTNGAHRANTVTLLQCDLQERKEYTIINGLNIKY